MALDRIVIEPFIEEGIITVTEAKASGTILPEAITQRKYKLVNYEEFDKLLETKQTDKFVYEEVKIEKDNEDVLITQPALDLPQYPERPDDSPMALSRMKIIDTIMENHNGIEFNNYVAYLLPLYSERNWYEPMSWLEFAYLGVYVFNIFNRAKFSKIVINTTISLSIITYDDTLIENIEAYKGMANITDYFESMRKGGRAMPLPLYLSYQVMLKRLKLSDEQMFREITEKDINLIARLAKG